MALLHRVHRFFPHVLTALCLAGAVQPGITSSAGIATSSGAAAPSAELIEQTWRQNGLRALCESMVQNILASVQHHPDLALAPTERRARLLSAYRKHATTVRFERRLKRYLLHANSDALQAMNALSQSTIGQRAMREEQRFSTVQPATLLAYWQTLRGAPEGSSRIALIRRLDDALGVTEIALNVAGASLYGTQMALGSDRNVSDRPANNGRISSLVNGFVSAMRPAQRQQVELTYLYLYRNLTLAELDEYVTRYEREPVRGLQRQLVQALGSEMIAVQSDVIAELAGSANADQGTAI